MHYGGFPTAPGRERKNRMRLFARASRLTLKSSAGGKRLYLETTAAVEAGSQRRHRTAAGSTDLLSAARSRAAFIMGLIYQISNCRQAPLRFFTSIFLEPLKYFIGLRAPAESDDAGSAWRRTLQTVAGNSRWIAGFRGVPGCPSCAARVSFRCAGVDMGGKPALGWICQSTDANRVG
jgi:hypothetical protein